MTMEEEFFANQFHQWCEHFRYYEMAITELESDLGIIWLGLADETQVYQHDVPESSKEELIEASLMADALDMQMGRIRQEILKN